MTPALTATECRRRYIGAFHPKPWLYWGDFSVSAGVGWAAFAVSIQSSIPSPTYLIATLVAVLALLFALRWGILGPLSFFIPSLRRFAVEQGSSLVINTTYRRPFPVGRAALRWRVQELTAALVFWGVVGAWFIDLLPSSWFIRWYVVSAAILLVNQVRTLAAHRYDNDGRPLTSVEQLLDSINLDGWPVPTVLAAPVGLRYHALHHFLPAVPYHSLGALHRQLREELPPDSPYHCATRGGILSTIWDLITRLQTEQPYQATTNSSRIHPFKNGSE